jgi:transposase
MPPIMDLRLPARYGQNDREIALNRKNALFAGSDVGASYCSRDGILIMEGDFGEDPEISGALIAWHRPRGAQIPLEGRKLG